MGRFIWPIVGLSIALTPAVGQAAPAFRGAEEQSATERRWHSTADCPVSSHTIMIRSGHGKAEVVRLLGSGRVASPGDLRRLNKSLRQRLAVVTGVAFECVPLSDRMDLIVTGYRAGRELSEANAVTWRAILRRGRPSHADPKREWLGPYAALSEHWTVEADCPGRTVAVTLDRAFGPAAVTSFVDGGIGASATTLERWNAEILKEDGFINRVDLVCDAEGATVTGGGLEDHKVIRTKLFRGMIASNSNVPYTDFYKP